MEKSSENTVEKAPQNTVSNACNTYNTYSAYNASREEKDAAFKAYKERQNHEQYNYAQYNQNQSSDKPEGKAIAALVLGICRLVFCFWLSGPGLVCAIVGACLGNSYTKGIGYGGKIMSWISIIACSVFLIMYCGLVGTAITASTWAMYRF